MLCWIFVPASSLFTGFMSSLTNCVNISFGTPYLVRISQSSSAILSVSATGKAMAPSSIFHCLQSHACNGSCGPTWVYSTLQDWLQRVHSENKAVKIVLYLLLFSAMFIDRHYKRPMANLWKNSWPIIIFFVPRSPVIGASSKTSSCFYIMDGILFECKLPSHRTGFCPHLFT